MARISSGVTDVSAHVGLINTETSIRSVLCDDKYPGDLELRSQVEENAFQALCEASIIKGPCHAVCASEGDEDNDCLSMTFPRKLWKIVESDQFKSIWWHETGTSIVINEELFKKEVLERKTPFRIFKTDNMKSLVRQLNLYGFSKTRQTFQRSASLAEFLEEEKVLSKLSKIQFYYNPNFKRGCPQLLVRIKRRVGIKNTSSASSLVQDFNKKPFGAERPVSNHNSGFVAETSGESLFSHATSYNVPLIRNSATSQVDAKRSEPNRTDVAPPPPTLLRRSEHMVMSQYAPCNQLAIFPVPSHSSYTQANTHLGNFIPASHDSQGHNISPSQGSSFVRIVQPPPFPNRYLYPPALSDVPFHVQVAGNQCFPMQVIADTSVASPLMATPQPFFLYVHQLHYN